MKTICPVCNREFELKQSEYNRGRRCCCKSCAGKYREINKRNMNKIINFKTEFRELANIYGDNVDINSLIRKLSNHIKELEKENKDLKSRLHTERIAKDWDNAVFNGCV